MTGTSGLVPARFTGKRLQLLKEFVPQASRIAVLIDPTMSAHQLELPKLPEAERQLGLELVIVEASKPDQFEEAFETAHKQGAEAIDVLNGPLLAAHSVKVVGTRGTLWSRPSSWWRFETGAEAAQAQWPWWKWTAVGEAAGVAIDGLADCAASGAPLSSPAPSAHRCAAAGLDSGTPAERFGIHAVRRRSGSREVG